MKLILLLFIVSAAVALDTRERDVLIELYKSNGGSYWRINDNWMVGDPCQQQWFGIECTEDGQHVTGVYLSHNNLVGVLPESLGALTMLDGLDVGVNALVGPLPASLGNCVHLEAVSFRENSISGPIPESLGKCTEMKWWHSAFNKLTSIPSSLASWTQIRVFDVAHNELHGDFPAFLANMKSMQMLFIGHNQLTGTLPVLSNMKNLLVLDAAYNKMDEVKLADILPVGSPSVIEIDLYGNTQITGTLPEDLLTRFPSLVVFAAARNNIIGTIPDVLGVSNSLNILSLEYNRLTGFLGLANATVPLINLTGNAFYCPLPSYANKFNATCNYWTMKRITPSEGPISGGMPVIIEGVGFQPDQPMSILCAFGSNIVPARVTSATTLTCTPPAVKSAGRYPVSILFNGRPIMSPDNVMYYTYIKAIAGAKSELAVVPVLSTSRVEPAVVSIKPRLSGDKVVVDIYGESKCPDFSSIEDVWIEVYAKLNSIMDVNFGFIAKKEDSYPTGFWSLHGQTEMIGNKYTACVEAKYDMKTFLNFAKCINANQSMIPVNIPACISSMGLNKEAIMKCTFGVEGQVLMTRSVAQADAAGATWSPTIYINGVQYCLWHSAPCPASSADDFIAVICAAYKGSNPPPACK